MFDLKELDRWVPVGKKGLRFPTKEPRRVRLEVLAEEDTALHVHDATGDHFIGVFCGYDVVQFYVQGVFELTAENEGVKVWTPEFDVVAAEVPEAVSFTRMMTRRTRNPEVERMMQTVTKRVEERIAQIERDYTLRVSAEQRQRIFDEREANRERREAEAQAAAGEPSEPADEAAGAGADKDE